MRTLQDLQTIFPFVLWENAMKVRVIPVLFAWVALALAGDLLFKRAPSVSSWQFGTGCLLYGACGLPAIFGFRLQQWGWICIAWTCLSLLLSLVLSVMVFSEPFTMRRAIGTVLALLAVFLAS